MTSNQNNQEQTSIQDDVERIAILAQEIIDLENAKPLTVDESCWIIHTRSNQLTKP